MSDNVVEIRITGVVDASLAAAITTAVAQATSGLKTAESATHDLHFATAGVIEDYFRLGQAATSGNLSSMASTLVNLGKETGVFDAALALMGPEAAVATGGLALVAGALGYLAYQEYQADQNLRSLAEAFALTGRGATDTKAAIDQELKDLEQYPHVTSAIAEGIVQWEAAHAEIDDRINTSVNQLAPQYAEAWGKTAPAALGVLKTALQDVMSGDKDVAASALDKINAELGRLSPRNINRLTEAQQDHIVKLINAGQRIEAINLLLADVALKGGGHIDALNTEIKNTSTELDKAKLVLQDVKDNAAALGVAFATDFANASNAVDGLTAKLKKLKAEAAAPTAIPIDAQAISEHLRQIANDTTKTDAQIYQAQVDYLEKEKGQHGLAAKASEYIDQQLADKTAQLKRQTMQDAIEDAREGARESGKTGEALLRDEIARDQKLLDEKKVTGQAARNLQRQIADERASLSTKTAHDEASAEKIGAEESISAARDASREILANDRLNVSERAALAKQIWELLDNGEKMSAGQRATAAHELAQRIAKEENLSAEQQKAVEDQLSSILVGSAQRTAQQRSQTVRDECSAESEARRQGVRETEQIDKLEAQSKVSAAKDAYELTSAFLDRELVYYGITESEKIAALKTAKQQELQVEIDGYQDQLDKLVATNQTKTLLYEQLDAKIKELNRQKNIAIAQADTQAAQEAAKTWQSIISPIESGMESMVSSLISGQETFGAATRQLLVQVVTDWINARIKIEFDYLAGKLAMELGDQEWMHKSILAAIFGANTKVAVNKAADLESTASGWAALTTQTGQVVASQAAQTGAVAAGAQARVATEATVRAEGSAAEVVSGSAHIMNDAYEAAAGAYKAIVGIPVIGPILAPIAAGVAFAAVSAFDTLTSAEGGLERVDSPAKFMITHKDESVLPARVAVPLMSFVGDLPGISEVVRRSGGLSSISDVGSLLPVTSHSASVRAGMRSPAQSDADYVASRVGSGGATSRGPASSAGSGSGGDIHIHAWDASSMNQFFRKPANRRTMDQISKDRVRAGFLPG